MRFQLLGLMTFFICLSPIFAGSLVQEKGKKMNENSFYEKACENIARDIEALKEKYPQLREFKASEALRNCTIEYSYKTKESQAKAGWARGMPIVPQDDGIYLYISVWEDSEVASQRSLQDAMPSYKFKDRKLKVDIFEGNKTESLYIKIWSIIKKHGGSDSFFGT